MVCSRFKWVSSRVRVPSAAIEETVRIANYENVFGMLGTSSSYAR